MHEVPVDLLQQRLQRREVFNAYVTRSEIRGIPRVGAKVTAASPLLTGCDFRYKWLSAEQKQQETACLDALASLPSSGSAEVSSGVSSEVSSGVTLMSSRMQHVLDLVAEGRKKQAKMLLIVESEKFLYAVACALRRQGLHLVELRGDPTNSSPSAFWDSESVTRFNTSSAGTVGVLCLVRFANPEATHFKCHYLAPVVQSVIVCEKAKSVRCPVMCTITSFSCWRRRRTRTRRWWRWRASWRRGCPSRAARTRRRERRRRRRRCAFCLA